MLLISKGPFSSIARVGSRNRHCIVLDSRKHLFSSTVQLHVHTFGITCRVCWPDIKRGCARKWRQESHILLQFNFTIWKKYLMHILQWPAPLTQLNISKQLPNRVLDIKTFHQILNCIYHKCNFVFYGHKAIKKKQQPKINTWGRIK